MIPLPDDAAATDGAVGASKRCTPRSIESPPESAVANTSRTAFQLGADSCGHHVPGEKAAAGAPKERSHSAAADKDSALADSPWDAGEQDHLLVYNSGSPLPLRLQLGSTFRL